MNASRSRAQQRVDEAWDSVPAATTTLATQAERVAAGRTLRTRAPRSSHAAWEPLAQGRDPIALIEQSNRGRLPELVPIRYGRMAASPFTFLRGSAALMAYDLSTTPSTGLLVQACGD